MLRKSGKSVVELSLLHMKIILSKYAYMLQSGKGRNNIHKEKDTMKENCKTGNQSRVYEKVPLKMMSPLSFFSSSPLLPPSRKKKYENYGL